MLLFRNYEAGEQTIFITSASASLIIYCTLPNTVVSFAIMKGITKHRNIHELNLIVYYNVINMYIDCQL